MIRLEEFWSTSIYPVYYLSTGERISSDEMMEHRNDIVVSFRPMNVIEYGMDTSMYVIGVELEDPEEDNMDDRYAELKTKLGSVYGKTVYADTDSVKIEDSK